MYQNAHGVNVNTVITLYSFASFLTCIEKVFLLSHMHECVNLPNINNGKQKFLHLEVR